MSNISPPAGENGHPRQRGSVGKVRWYGFILFTVAVLVLLVKLGLWQLSRGEQKQQLIDSLDSRGQGIARPLAGLPEDGKGYRVAISGIADITRSVLLDNQIFNGRPGYRWFVPVDTGPQQVLVELGWIAAPQFREQLPALPALDRLYRDGLFYIEGIADRPSDRLTLKDEPVLEVPVSGAPVSGALTLENQADGNRAQEKKNSGWPWRVQRIDIGRISARLGAPVSPWVIRSVPQQGGLAVQHVWQPVVMKPEKHYAYALQWFCLALAIGVLIVVWCFKNRA